MVSFQTIIIILAIGLILLSLMLSYRQEKEFFENNIEEPDLQENTDQIESMENNERYIIVPDKMVKGARLQGSHEINDKNITFDEYGRPIGQIMSIEKSKEVCDVLGDKCAGFIIQTNDNSDKSIANFFVSKVESGFDEPSLNSNEVLQNENNIQKYQKFTSFIKK